MSNSNHPLKKLLGQTAVYGLSTIVSRLAYFALAPFHTRVFTTGEFGVVSELYAYVAFLNVLFMFGLETAFFRFASHDKKPKIVFKTAFTLLTIITTTLTLVLISQAQVLSLLTENEGRTPFIRWLLLIVAFDSLANLPFAQFRLQEKALRYALIKALNVGVNIACNIFFLMPLALDNYELFSAVGFTYQPGIGPGYVFLANLIASIVTLLVLLPGILKNGFGIHVPTMKKLIGYSWPLVIVGFAGMINETLDRVLLKQLLPGSIPERESQIGIYGAVYKLAIFMTLMIQAFRMGAEPFFFNRAKDRSSPKLYAQIMHYFVAACATMFLVVTLFIDVAKIIIGENFHEGLHIVPILLLANLFLGVFYNLSVWYKLTDKTHYAMILAISGAAITLALNWLFIPTYGYVASAWATLACYLFMVLLSYAFSRKFFPVPYNVGLITGLLGLALGLFYVDHLWISDLVTNQPILAYTLKAIAVLFYATLITVYFKRQPTALGS